MDHGCKPGNLQANAIYLARPTRSWLAALLLALLLSGCQFPRPLPPAAPTQMPASAFTAGAGTVFARFTQQAGETAVAQLTAIAETAETTVPATPTTAPPAPSSTPAPPDSPSPLPPTQPEAAAPPSATPTPPGPAAPCEQAEFIAHLTLPPDSIVAAGVPLTKIWRVRNSGACEWTPAFALVYSSGSLPGGGPSTALPFVVRPGETVDLAVTLVAPPYTGQFTGEWRLRNPAGVLFGNGPQNLPFNLRIITSPPAQTANGYDLAAGMCAAAWRSSSGPLTCPGLPADLNGSVLQVQSPLMEGRQAAGTAMITRPPAAPGSWIQGVYPAYTVRPGDYFLADTACLQRETGCNLLFQFGYQRLDGGFEQLARWSENGDGRSTPVQVDLSPLAGYSPSFSLIVTDQGGLWVGGAWLQPRIQRQDGPTAYTLVWERQRPDRNECQELRVTLDSFGERGEAQAFDCQAGRAELGRLRLDDQEVAQLLTWVERLESFDGEIYTIINGHPVIAWIDFHGQGTGSASGDEMAALDALAARLYELIAR